MRVLSQQSEDLLSNSYLVIDPATGHCAFIDCGQPVDHLLAVIGAEGLTLERILLTHHHGDHISGLDHILDLYPGVPIHAHPLEGAEMLATIKTTEPGDLLVVGDLEVTALGTPGHTAGMLSYYVAEPGQGRPGEVFTGDTLFRGSIGGLAEPGATNIAELKHSILDVLLRLPLETVIEPGHAGPSTVREEFHRNPFVRVWLNEQPEGTDRVLVAPVGEPREAGRLATLVVWALDFDGGHKAQVRFVDDETETVVPGSWIYPAE